MQLTKHVLSRPVTLPDAKLTAVALRRPTRADIAVLRKALTTSAHRSPKLIWEGNCVAIAQLTDLSPGIVRTLPFRDINKLARQVHDLIAKALAEGM